MKIVDTQNYNEIEESIVKFIQQANAIDIDLKTKNIGTKDYPKTYMGYNIKISFGKGSPAKVPWLAFLKGNNKIIKGIYPIILYFKREEELILSFGISYYLEPMNSWKLGKEFKTIEAYFEEKKYEKSKYGKSLVYKVYKVKNIDIKNLSKDINSILKIYDLHI